MHGTLDLLLISAGIGLLVSIPPGGVTALFVAAIARRDDRCGRPAALGAATADAILCVLAFSLTLLIVAPPPWVGDVAAAIAAITLGSLGLFTLDRARRRRRLVIAGDAPPPESDLSLGIQCFAIALLNPGSLPTMIVVFLAFGFSEAMPWTGPAALVCGLGAFFGAFVWWMLLGRVLHQFRFRLRGAASLLETLAALLFLIGAGAATTHLVA